MFLRPRHFPEGNLVGGRLVYIAAVETMGTSVGIMSTS